MFAANLLDWAEPIRTGGVARQPYADARQAPVHETDIVAVAAAALLTDEHVRAIYTLTGPESLTKLEQAAAIGAGLGKDVRFEEISPTSGEVRSAPIYPSTSSTGLGRQLRAMARASRSRYSATDRSGKNLTSSSTLATAALISGSPLASVAVDSTRP
ncbi:MAG: hypothetical protein ACRDTA_06070 [Pseudonocardiaceae bacterium]